jgi:hypothetical protein
MPRRVNLPGASELFRPTGAPAKAPAKAGGAKRKASAPMEPSGRVRHDEKITVYVSAEELIAVEQARLQLRQEGIVVDRGHFVRAALAGALDDLRAHGLKAEVVRRLGET